MAEPELQRPSGVVLVLTTVPDSLAGQRIAERLLEERLIACANLLPGLTSLYRWEGEVAREPEVLMLIKTPETLVERVHRRIHELHPYELPELLTLPADAGSTAYCHWVRQETTEVNS